MNCPHLVMWMGVGAIDFAINLAWLAVFAFVGVPVVDPFRKAGEAIGIDSAWLAFGISLALSLLLGPVGLALSAQNPAVVEARARRLEGSRMNCAHGRKAIACEGCHPEGPPPELLRAINLIAEAKTLFVIAAQGTRPGTPERARTLDELARLNGKVRDHLATIGGAEVLPDGLRIQVRVCELGHERLTR